MINTAAIYCKAAAAKIQKRCPKGLLNEEQYNAPHPHPEDSYGSAYGLHRETAVMEAIDLLKGHITLIIVAHRLQL